MYYCVAGDGNGDGNDGIRQYNTKFPEWSVAMSKNPSTPFDGQMAYAYAKRGQVLLCEQWTAQHPEVEFASCHPGYAA